MRRFAFQGGLNFVLAVAVLVGGSVPPSVCHAHAGGDLPHRHDNDHAVRHNADNRRENEFPQDAHDDDDYTICDVVSHVHVNFLGFHMTMPSSERDRHKSDEKQPNDQTLVTVFSDGPAIVGQNSSVLRCLSQPLAELLHPCSCITHEHRHIGKSAETCSIPLCDTARRERTGVFII